MFYQLRSSAYLEFHRPIWCEHKYWNSCLTGLSKWSAVSCCINYSGIKSRECVISVISITSAFWILHSMMIQTRMKMRELTLREKQAMWMLKEKRKSIRAIAKTKGMEKSRVWKPPATNNYLIGWENNSSWWQKNHKSCENEPYKTCHQQLPESWRDALTIYCPQETLTQNYRRYTARCKPQYIRVSKKAQRWAKRVLELCLWTDETKMNLYLSDGKATLALSTLLVT